MGFSRAFLDLRQKNERISLPNPSPRYAHKINHFSAFAVTKLDVLDKLKKVAICHSYTILPPNPPAGPSGDNHPESGISSLNTSTKCQTIDYFPADAKILERCQPNYIWLDGWESDTTGVRDYEKLPENARKFIEKLEEILGVRVGWIGVGPDREAIIVRD